MNRIAIEKQKLEDEIKTNKFENMKYIQSIAEKIKDSLKDI